MIEDDIQPVLRAIERRRPSCSPIVVAIDGRSGTGKSTLGRAIARSVGGAYIDQDDFYSGGELDAWGPLDPAERVDRCIDWRRVRDEVLIPLRRSKSARYFPFDWDTMEGTASEPIDVAAADIVILDGAYSTRSELLDLIDLTVLVTLGDEIRRQRIMEREGEDWTEEWFAVWDAAEELYFGTLRPPDAFDIVIDRSPTS